MDESDIVSSLVKKPSLTGSGFDDDPKPSSLSSKVLGEDAPSVPEPRKAKRQAKKAKVEEPDLREDAEVEAPRPKARKPKPISKPILPEGDAEESASRAKRELKRYAFDAEASDDDGEEEDSESSSEEEKPRLSKATKARAAEYGIEEDEADDIGEEKLVRILDAMDRKFIKGEKEKAVPASQKARDEVPSKSKSQPKSDEGDDVDSDDFQVEFLDDDLLEDAVKKNLKGLSEHVSKKLAQLHRMVDNVTKAVGHEQNRSYISRFDAWVATLPDEYREFIGEGKSLKLDKESPHFKARVDILDDAAALARVYADKGISMPDEDELWMRAAKGLFADEVNKKAKTKARDEIADALEKRSRNVMERSIGRNNGNRVKDEFEEATRFVRNFRRESR